MKFSVTQSYPLFVTPQTVACQASLSMEFSRQEYCSGKKTNIAVGSHSLLQGIFPTQGSNPGLLYCRRILYQLSPKGSLKSTLGLLY